MVHEGIKFSTSGIAQAVAFELSNPAMLSDNSLQFHVTLLKGRLTNSNISTLPLLRPKIFVDFATENATMNNWRGF